MRDAILTRRFGWVLVDPDGDGEMELEPVAPEAGIVLCMTEPLCVLTVHAHPDDEASKGAGTREIPG